MDNSALQNVQKLPVVLDTFYIVLMFCPDLYKKVKQQSIHINYSAREESIAKWMKIYSMLKKTASKNISMTIQLVACDVNLRTIEPAVAIIFQKLFPEVIMQHYPNRFGTSEFS